MRPGPSPVTTTLNPEPREDCPEEKPDAERRELQRSSAIRPWHLVVAGLVLLAGSIASLFVGVSAISPADLLRLSDDQVQVLLISRVPRLVAILLAGTALSVAGLIMMHLARNRFVTPSTAGTAESAGLGILVATMFFGSESIMAKMLIAVVFAILGTLIFLQILKRLSFQDMIVVPLVGIMFGGVITAVTTFFAYRADLLQTLSTWTSGDFSGVLAGRYELLWVAGGLTVIGYLYADRFTVAGMGESFAINLGISYNRVINLGLLLVAVMTAVTVVTVGDIPFLGLIVPNLVCMALGDNLRRVLPITALAGAFVVLICDVIGRIIRFPYEIPVGTVVGVLGSAIFIVLILRTRSKAA
ncbi:ABC transporter permease [Tomitella biformata]|uniref:ABC transporter permease n=1 Tax=Tomitella biformata TaxID=630403 RepID=UPI000A0226B4|nr:ABC transporter permease [Tomitella biformata]